MPQDFQQLLVPLHWGWRIELLLLMESVSLARSHWEISNKTGFGIEDIKNYAHPGSFKPFRQFQNGAGLQPAQRWPSMATLKQAHHSRGQKMTPKQATKAYQRGDLREGTLVNQPYGFLIGELHDGQVLSVDCNAAGAVKGVVVQWPDDAAPVYAPIEDLTLEREDVKPTLLNRVQSFFARQAA
jgi:hypothetical protein